jgi:hypothetical protein
LNILEGDAGRCPQGLNYNLMWLYQSQCGFTGTWNYANMKIRIGLKGLDEIQNGIKNYKLPANV